WLTVADVTGDGSPDLVVAANDLYLFHLDGSGALAQVAVLPQASKAWAATSADLDGNGLADLVTSMTNGGLLGVRLQTSPGVFSAESTLKPLPAWSGVVGPPGFGDLDGDGALDGVMFVNGQLVPLSGDGHGALAAATPLEAGFYSGLPIVA